MSKTDNKILFLDEDVSEIEFRVIEQTTIAGHTYLLVEDCEASSEDESVVLIMKEVQLEDCLLYTSQNQKRFYLPLEEQNQIIQQSSEQRWPIVAKGSISLQQR